MLVSKNANYFITLTQQVAVHIAILSEYKKRDKEVQIKILLDLF